MRAPVAVCATALLVLLTGCTGSDAEDAHDDAAPSPQQGTSSAPVSPWTEPAPVRTTSIPNVAFGPHLSGPVRGSGPGKDSEGKRRLEPCPNASFRRYPADRDITALAQAVIDNEQRTINLQLSVYPSIDDAARLIEGFAAAGVRCTVGGRYFAQYGGERELRPVAGVDDMAVHITVLVSRPGPQTIYAAAAQVENAIFLVSIVEDGILFEDESPLSPAAAARLRHRIAAAVPALRRVYATG